MAAHVRYLFDWVVHLRLLHLARLNALSKRNFLQRIV